MTVVRPFVGTRYNAKHVGDLREVYAPPYDVISPAMQEALHSRHPNNCVRLILGRHESDDDAQSNRHTRAAATFARWREEGVMVDDAAPSFYIYTQTFDLPGRGRVTRTGFFGAVELVELGPGGIMAHEHTFEGPKADRFALMQATNANLSAVFSLYTDEAGTTTRLFAERMAAEPPWDTATTDDGVDHALWVVNDAAFISAVREVLADQPIYIADGHHRCETALRYAAFCRGEKSADAAPTPTDHVLMYLVNTEDTGLEILPTHRVLHRDLATDVEEFKNDIGEFFDVTSAGIDWSQGKKAAEKIQRALAKAGEKRTAFAVLLPGGETMLLTLRDGADLDAMIEEPMPTESKSLDVTILHSHLINRRWVGNPEYELDEEECRYVRDIAEAMDLLAAGKHCVAFLMNAPTMAQMRAVSTLGERMPHKSTYFYPKVGAGVVARDMGTALGEP